MNTTREFITSRLDRLEDWREHPDPAGADIAAVLLPLVERGGSLSVILTVRPTTLRRHAGQIALPGGRAEAGERPWETALRESHEEIGLEPGRVEVAGLIEPLRVGGWFCVTPVVGFVAPGFEPKPSPEEVAEIFETPFDFLMDAANQREHVVEHEGRVRHTVAIPWQDRYIWGATAHVLRSLQRRLYPQPEAKRA